MQSVFFARESHALARWHLTPFDANIMQSSCYTSDRMKVRPTFEFHISRAARNRYEFSETLFSMSGNAIFANLSASREFAERMNRVRGAEKDPQFVVHPGALNAMGLIDEALHLIVEQYRQQRDPQAIVDALAFFESRLGRPDLDRTLATR